MTFWDLLFTNQNQPRLSLGSGISFCQLLCWWLATFPSDMSAVQKLPTLLVLGTVDSSLDHQCLVYSRPHAFDR